MAENVGPVQVPLAGLYGMLGVKAGQNPDVITGFVQPVISTEGYWLRATREQVGTFVAVPGIDALQLTGFLAVPQNEWWYIHDWYVATDDPAVLTDPGVLYVGVQDPVSAGFTSLLEIPAQYSPTGGAVAGTLRRGVMKDVWVPPGSALVVVDNSLVTTTVNILPAHVSRLRV